MAPHQGALYLLVLLSGLCAAKIFTNFTDIPTRHFDFVIIGSGAGGNVVANRLTEDPHVSVLVLEAGGSNERVLESEVPFLCTKLSPKTPFDWNYTTVPQAALNNLSVSLPRGYILGGSTSISWIQGTIKGGKRSSSATSYLGPEFINRPNLHVLLQARVSRLLCTDEVQGKKSFRSVEFAQNEGTSLAGPYGPKVTVTASKSVILSAGSIGTPNILLHSGIGDKKLLSKVGIPTLHHLPDVGQNLFDHPITRNAWVVNSTDTFETHLRNGTILEADLAEWYRFQTGYLATSRFSFIGWTRLPQNASIFQYFQDPSAGPNTAHMELFFGNGMSTLPPTGNFFGLSTGVVSPVSKGALTINSTDPFDPPLIDLGLLSSEFDMFAMREAIRSGSRFLAAPAWSGYIISPAGALANVNISDDEQLDAYIRSNSGSLFHPVGTASMSPYDCPDGVVDPDLKVKGIEGVRIVDASVMPRIPAAHTQAPTYVIAERAADLIKEAFKSSWGLGHKSYWQIW
ncbi:hypothetical protein ONZ45_g17664 [Pleurotus djamor]|nr:hypothetical protein ONZ45_g17664 [Pleurotus djamor]